MKSAGRVTCSGVPPKTASMAAFDIQSMRFSASWNVASTSVPAM